LFDCARSLWPSFIYGYYIVSRTIALNEEVQAHQVLLKYLHKIRLQYYNRLYLFPRSAPPLPSSFQERPHALKWSPSPLVFMTGPF